MAGNAYSAETKAAALAEIASGNTAAFVAKQLGVGITTVRAWLGEQRREVLPLSRARSQLLSYEVYELVRLNIKALAAITEVSSDPEYLRQQNARDLAVLYGVQADKVYRLLRSLARGAEAEDGRAPSAVETTAEVVG